MKKNLTLTPASDWGVFSEIVELPSGKVAEFKRLNVLMMLERGGDDIPNFLKAYVARSIRGEANSKNPMDAIEDPTEAVKMITFLARQVFLFPKLVNGKPQADDEVTIDLVDAGDLSFAAAYGLGDPEVIKQLETFRNEAASNVEPVPTGNELEPEAVADTGD